MYDLDRYKKHELNPAIQRFIKRKEAYLDRTCRMIWEYTNPKDEKYLLASFCKNYDRLIVTIGYFNKGIWQFITPR